MSCATLGVAVLLLAVAVASAQTATTNTDQMLRDAAQAFADGDFNRAESQLHDILKVSPRNYRALDFLGMLRAQQQRNTDAEQLFQEASRVKPDFAGSHVHLGLLYMQMNEPAKAIAPLQEGLRIDPNRSDAAKALLQALRQEAQTALAAGQTEKSLSMLISARKLAPDDPDVAYEYGMVTLRMALLPDAIAAFKDTLKSRRDDPLAIYGLGRAYMDSSDFEHAQQQFARYTELRPDDASGHYALGMSLAALQRGQDATREFQKSISLQPAQTESYFRLGVLQLEARDLDSAETNFHHVLDRNPKHAGALAALGRVELERKQYQQAADLLQTAVASNDSLREAHYYLGLAYARMGRKEESDQQLQIAARIEHEEAEKQRTVFKILNNGSLDSTAAPDAANTNPSK
jgi:tetratricopeptide (TPR) repeat protein